jgi:multisubunit Na+/H+ antiporter MnhC subunit
MGKKKHHLTKQEEFDLMKIVFDKFLLLSVLLMALGVYLITSAASSFSIGFSVLGGGAIVMILFGILAVRAFNFLEH